MRRILAAGAAATILFAPPANATGSTFVGSSFNHCNRPPAPSFGTSTGTGTCTVEAWSFSCTTSVDVDEVAVVSPCYVELTGTTSLFFVQARTEQGGPLRVHCFGSGSGTVTYRATPSSPEQRIPVTITVHDQTASFSGFAVIGVLVVVVEGTYTNACGGSGAFAGEVL